MDGGDGVITAAAAAAIRVWREAVRATTMTTMTIQPNERAVLLNPCLDELLNHPMTTVVVASKAAAIDDDSNDSNDNGTTPVVDLMDEALRLHHQRHRLNKLQEETIKIPRQLAA
mmetsp:Transcript_7650/g.14977  ORF Transcript_7650/g.14977 Transcript_7650/m.14977 type:complete len:115 (-) Transcript_7650:255-599(-)